MMAPLIVFALVFVLIGLVQGAEARRAAAELARQKELLAAQERQQQNFLWQLEALVDEVVSPIAAVSRDIPKDWKSFVGKLVNRAKASNRWQDAIELARTKAVNPACFAYAVAQLLEAQANWCKTPADVTVGWSESPRLVANDHQ